MQTSQRTEMLARRAEVARVAVVTSMEWDCRMHWYLYRVATDYCCLLHCIFVVREGRKGVQEGQVLPLLNQRDEQKVCGVLKGEEWGWRVAGLQDCNYIPASEGERGEAGRVKPGRCDKQAFPWLSCRHADRQRSSFGTELLQ